MSVQDPHVKCSRSPTRSRSVGSGDRASASGGLEICVLLLHCPPLHIAPAAVSQSSFVVHTARARAGSKLETSKKSNLLVIILAALASGSGKACETVSRS